jgi:RNA polymerase sigma factor (sigma-70 family)
MDFYDLLFNYGLRHTRNRELVEDSIQNIFSYFIKVREGLAPVNNLFGYLLKSFRNQLFLELKKNDKFISTDTFNESDFEYFTSQEENIITEEESRLISSSVQRSLSLLPSKQQEIIYLRFDCGFSYPAISDILGITVESCQKTIFRAIKSLREDLKTGIKTSPL